MFDGIVASIKWIVVCKGTDLEVKETDQLERSEQVQCSNPMEVEDGVQKKKFYSTAVNRWIQLMEVEVDAVGVIQLLINDANVVNHPFRNIILMDCTPLMLELDVVAINHSYRKANHCADALANDAPVLVKMVKRREELRWPLTDLGLGRRR
ncbi:hypothetical protein RHMOL_Rhmol06G0223900 [Rhododendron molle]|uniref:Uncharacterized protein n=4 Tax=Rhododendron molle TaxID=49168 RepID=A0ACC0NGP5_RHOML|nr:hypothetical protein RHMOL_Rhmol06G0223900 [Rhododendron molle]KAI8551911.1 hypothetical protein RHMOL_Rhmol06G0223900 [Rhododendron molle]KAI8551912.1 hypothetical protein RHMOL_Rhmol06G0223900 [Rhododendron molle]KAI8551913.1 hypothetical protein RHMOL_Rhmol06G0223900 [Rhododendron molle]